MAGCPLSPPPQAGEAWTDRRRGRARGAHERAVDRVDEVAVASELAANVGAVVELGDRHAGRPRAVARRRVGADGVGDRVAAQDVVGILPRRRRAVAPAQSQGEVGVVAADGGRHVDRAVVGVLDQLVIPNGIVARVSEKVS